MLIIHESFVSSGFNLFKFKRKGSKFSERNKFSKAPARSSHRRKSSNNRRFDELSNAHLQFFLPPSQWRPDDRFSGGFDGDKRPKKVFPGSKHKGHKHRHRNKGYSNASFGENSLPASFDEPQRIPSSTSTFRRAYVMDDSSADGPKRNSDPDRIDTQLHPLPIYGSTINHFDNTPPNDPFINSIAHTPAEQFLTPPPAHNHVSLPDQPEMFSFPPSNPCPPLQSAFRSEDDYEHDYEPEKKCKPETIIKYKIQKVKVPPKIIYKVKKVYVPKPVQVIKEVPVIKHVPIIKEKEKVIPIVKKKIIIKKIKVPVPYKVKYIKIKKVPVMKKIKVPVIRKVVKFIPKSGTVKHIHVHKVTMEKEKKKKKMGMMKKMKMKMKKKKMGKMMASMCTPMCPSMCPAGMAPMLPMVPGVPVVGRRKRELPSIATQVRNEVRRRERRGILSNIAMAALFSNSMATRMMMMNQGNRMKFADECADEEQSNGVNFSSMFNGMNDDSSGMDDVEKRKRRRKKRSLERSLLLGPRIVFFDAMGWKYHGPAESVRFPKTGDEKVSTSFMSESPTSSLFSANSSTTSIHSAPD